MCQPPRIPLRRHGLAGPPDGYGQAHPVPGRRLPGRLPQRPGLSPRLLRRPGDVDAPWGHRRAGDTASDRHSAGRRPGQASTLRLAHDPTPVRYGPGSLRRCAARTAEQRARPPAPARRPRPPGRHRRRTPQKPLSAGPICDSRYGALRFVGMEGWGNEHPGRHGVTRREEGGCRARSTAAGVARPSKRSTRSCTGTGSTATLADSTSTRPP